MSARDHLIALNERVTGDRMVSAVLYLLHHRDEAEREATPPSACMCGTPTAENVDHDRDGCSYMDGFLGGLRITPPPARQATPPSDPDADAPGWLPPSAKATPPSAGEGDERHRFEHGDECRWRGHGG